MGGDGGMLALYEPNAIPDEGSFALACVGVGVGVGGFAGVESMKIIRVFPRQTKLTPTDDLSFLYDPKAEYLYGPPVNAPEAEEVHVSVTFTWDIERAHEIADMWRWRYPVVKVGGPALGDKPNGFTPGVYINDRVTFTTSGCDRRCPWCLVWKREGKLQEIENFPDGCIIQDNNLCQASMLHIERVFEMLARYKKATRRFAIFSGGLDARIIASEKGDKIVELLQNADVKQLFLAADSKNSVDILKGALEKLEFFGRCNYGLIKKVYCYTLIGFDGETIPQARERLEAVYQAGCLPFSQLYQPDDHYVEWSKEWKRFARTWSRPAAMKSMHGNLT